MNHCIKTIPACCSYLSVLHVAMYALKRRWCIATNAKFVRCI